MGRVEPYKVEQALKFLKSKLTEFRAEERRKVTFYKVKYNTCFIHYIQVLGHAPYSGMQCLQTPQLCNALIRQMHAPDDVQNVYVRHLALFVSF